MQVSFSESTNFSDYNTVIIVAEENGKDFIDGKIRALTGYETPKVILESCSNLKYNEIKSFNLVLGSSVVELIVAGAGQKTDLHKASVEKLGGYIYSAIKSNESKACIFNNLEKGFHDAVSYIVSGMSLKSWVFDKYKTKKNNKKVSVVNCITCYIELNEKAYSKLKNTNDSVCLTRTLVAEPSNIMTPEQMLAECQNLKKLGVKIFCLDKKDMEKLGMNALLGVAKGSDLSPYTIIMEYKTDKTKEQIALVGKGLTFDSGGISLKPSKGMGDMKCDMAGAAVVVGVLKSLASNNVEANIVGLIGVAENMISGKAQKPGDVVESMSKKTIEIDNTDAEGRLVLADVLHYACEKFEPSVIIDFATLTGAIQVALGHEFAGLFSNSDELANSLVKAGKAVGEKLWRLPLSPSYEDDIKSDIADIKNVGCGRGAGSITAAMFLQHFIKKDVKWAHIDIAATEWDNKNRALSQKGATGFGVRLTEEFVLNYYKSKQ